jgi:hypothetical protein
MVTPLNDRDRKRRPTDDDALPAVQRMPGKTSRAESRYGSGSAATSTPVVQLRPTPPSTDAHDDPFGLHVQDAAERGVSGAGGSALPHGDAIQRSFGRHDISGVTAHVGGAATAACDDIGAQAYATGTRTAFAAAPDLHTAAHEAAHTVQQRAGVQLKGGVGESGDEHEQHADAVADAVVSGRSAEGLLDRYAGGGSGAQSAVQLKGEPTLRKGSSGKTVKKLQQRLNAKATTEPPLGVDGTFGDKTEAAVIAFQHNHTDTTGTQLDEDGVVGKLTWGAINLEHETPEIDATTEALGDHVAKEMNANNDDPHEANRGVHYDFNYKALFPEKWKDDYSNGYADATYFERIGYMDWRLKPGKSASAAVQSWLHGLTIAECASAIVCMQHDSLRAAIGDKKFDEKFGSTDKQVPESARLRIRQYTSKTGIDEFMTDTEESIKGDGGTFNNRPLKPGDWCYFYNHPKYLLKHPGGAFQGENSIYVGKDDNGDQIFSGMGVDRATETKMMLAMIQSYNYDRDEWDEKALARIKADNGGTLPAKYEDNDTEFPHTLTDIQQILDEPEYELDGTKRKGGFVPDSGRRLDPGKVAAAK